MKKNKIAACLLFFFLYSFAKAQSNLEDTIPVAYGAQRKVSVVGAISTVHTASLQSSSISSVSNMLTGRIAGLIGLQSSGEPGQDVTEFRIRGISTFGEGSSASVVIDGIERGLAALYDLAPEDIVSLSVLKDATATSLYGTRGANGVFLITTKRGEEGAIKINANFKTGIETIPRQPKYLRAYDYALLANEAAAGRGNLPVYSPLEMDIIKYRIDPDLYPDVSWLDEILGNQTLAYQGNINLTGGGKLARYYMSGYYRSNEAMYRTSGLEKYHSNLRRNQYSFRSNVDVNVTPSTLISLLLSSKFVEQNRAGMNETQSLWEAATTITPLTMPIVYSNGLFPCYGADNQASPTVLLNETGYQTHNNNTIESLLIIQQDIIDGLKLTGSLSLDVFNNHIQRRYKMPDLYKAEDHDRQTSNLLTTQMVAGTPMTYSTSSYATRAVYAEARINYDKIIREKHRIGVMALYRQNDFQRTEAYDELMSIPLRNQGIAGRLTYSFDDIYFVEGNFGYNGSENFPKGQRFGFFPSLALGYVVSNYPWIKDHSGFINMLKFRFSTGLSGNDQIAGSDVRFPYLTTVNMGATGYYYGDVPEYESGITETTLGSTGLTWEKAVKHNVGIDLQLWKMIDITVDAFMDRRNNIFMARSTLPGTMGVNSTIWGNVGRMKSWGTDGALSFRRQFGDFHIEMRSHFTFTQNKILEYDEVAPRYPHLAQKGYSYGATRGLVALGLFRDEEDVKNSPKQFGTTLPGDIKYKDVNDDGVINDYDVVPIGNARIPKVQYGFSGSLGWKGIDCHIFFRGSGKANFFLEGAGYYPFSGETLGNVLTIVNDPKNRWTPASYSGDPATENPNARFPRLTYGNNPNNNRHSSFWLADAAFLRLKTAELGYTLPGKWTKKCFINLLRISLVGDNLHVWDKVKLIDPEQADSNGAAYPLTRSYTFALQFSF